MENNLLNIALFGEYSIKEMTKEEFLEKTDYKSEHQALTDLIVEVMGKDKESTINSIKTKSEDVFNMLNGITRSFGIYFSDEYIGYISFIGYDGTTPEIQIELTESHRNKGIGYRALSLLINLIFKEKQDIEYFVYCASVDNVASIKLVEKLGGEKVKTGHFIERLISKYHILKR